MREGRGYLGKPQLRVGGEGIWRANSMVEIQKPIGKLFEAFILELLPIKSNSLIDPALKYCYAA